MKRGTIERHNWTSWQPSILLHNVEFDEGFLGPGDGVKIPMEHDLLVLSSARQDCKEFSFTEDNGWLCGKFEYQSKSAKEFGYLLILEKAAQEIESLKKWGLVQPYENPYDDAAKVVRDLKQCSDDLKIKRWLFDFLVMHWLTSIDCNHEEKIDVAHCICGWNGTPQPSVGDAVKQHVEHVTDLLLESNEGVS